MNTQKNTSSTGKLDTLYLPF